VQALPGETANGTNPRPDRPGRASAGTGRRHFATAVF